MIRLFRLRRFRNAYLIRGALVWCGVRLGAAAMELTPLNVLEAGFILSVVGAAVFLDARRRNEDVFLGNLGIPPGAIVGWALALAVVLEALVP